MRAPRILIFTTLFFTHIISYCQNSVSSYDLFHQLKTYNARSMGMMGSTVGFGTDISNNSNNPAGLAFINREQVSLSYFMEEGEVAENNSFDLSYIVPTKFSFIKNYKINIGFSFTRTRNLKNEYNFLNSKEFGKNYTNSLGNYLLTDSKAKDINIATQLASESGFLTPSGNEYTTSTNIPQNYWLKNSELILASGNNDKLDFFMSFYNKYFAWGFTISLYDYDKNLDIVYKESDIADKNKALKRYNRGEGIPDYNYIEYNKNYVYENYGIDLKLGISKHFKRQNFKISAAIHSPRLYSVNEKFNFNFVYLSDVKIPTIGEYKGTSKYSGTNHGSFISSPKFIVGLGKTFGNIFLIDASYEFQNYAWASSSISNYRLNNKVEEHNARIGAELKLGFLYARAGVQYITNPFKDYKNYLGENINQTLTHLNHSFGFGYRLSQLWYLDFAYVINNRTNEFTISDEKYQNFYDFSYNKETYIISFGYKI